MGLRGKPSWRRFRGGLGWFGRDPRQNLLEHLIHGEAVERRGIAMREFRNPAIVMQTRMVSPGRMRNSTVKATRLGSRGNW